MHVSRVQGSQVSVAAFFHVEQRLKECQEELVSMKKACEVAETETNQAHLTCQQLRQELEDVQHTRDLLQEKHDAVVSLVDARLQEIENQKNEFETYIRALQRVKRWIPESQTWTTGSRTSRVPHDDKEPHGRRQDLP